MSATTPRPRTMTRVATGTGATLALATVALAATGTAGHAADYTVREGDTLSSIAKRTGTTVSRIARDNALSDPSRVRAGQVLRLPDAAPAATAAPVPARAGASYVVRSGDTVSAIASRHGTTVAAVVAANGLDARAFIRAGQALTIPGTGNPQPAAPAAPAAAPTSTGSTYTVRTGDTVSAIASRHGTTVAAVVAANGLDARASIRAGQNLTIPGAAAPAPTTQLVGNTFAGRTYAAAVVDAANQNKATLLAAGVPSRADMQAKVAATARAMGVDAALAQAVAHQESGFDHRAVSPANAIGTMQVIPSSGEWASQLVGRPLDLLSPDDNVVAGVAILRSLVRTSPDLPTAIASYYQGASSVKRNGMYADTRRYVANVQTLMTRFG